MRWRHDWRNTEIISVKGVQPELSPSGVIDEVVCTVIIIDLEEEFDIVGKYNMFLRSHLLDLVGPITDFGHHIGVIQISLGDNSGGRMPIEIKLPFRMSTYQPLGREIRGPIQKIYKLPQATGSPDLRGISG